MTDTQIDKLVAVLERIARSLEVIANPWTIYTVTTGPQTAEVPVGDEICVPAKDIHPFHTGSYRPPNPNLMEYK